MAWERLPPFASDLHFNVRRVETRMLLKGVTMINHLKSKILITGRNFCYLRRPLIARKKKKKIITGYFPEAESGEGWGISCCSEMGGQGPTRVPPQEEPPPPPPRCRVGPGHGAGAKQRGCFSGVWGLVRVGGGGARTSCPLSAQLQGAGGMGGTTWTEPHLWVPLEASSWAWQLVASSFPRPSDP